LLEHDADFGHRWAVECIRGGLLLNPNEKWYVSITHDDDDLDQTFEILDGAFRRALG
jgi:glutamate-1-semialdehyde aminotransferase